jgi:hypothetical protein
MLILMITLPRTCHVWVTLFPSESWCGFFIVMHHFYEKYFFNNFSFEHTIFFTNKFPLPMDGNPPLKNKFQSCCTLNYLARYCCALFDFQISVNKTVQCQPCNLEQIVQNRIYYVWMKQMNVCMWKDVKWMKGHRNEIYLHGIRNGWTVWVYGKWAALCCTVHCALQHFFYWRKFKTKNYLKMKLSLEFSVTRSQKNIRKMYQIAIFDSSKYP